MTKPVSVNHETSQRVWEDLIVEQGWSGETRRVHLTALLDNALLT